jgi:hypothetical protein
MFLLNQNNRNNWIEWFKCPYDLAMQGACVSSKNTYYKALDDLQSFNLIEYQKGINLYKSPKIKILPLIIDNSVLNIDTLTEQVSVPQSEPQSVPQTEPLCELLNKNTYKLITDNIETINLKQKEVDLFLESILPLNNQEQKRKKVAQKKENETNVKYQLESQKKQVETKQDEKERMLTISKGQEKNYEQVIADRKKRVAQINARLFALRGQKGIPFGDALRYAKEAYTGGSGVRPALVLAILTQESNLGKNVGGCYLTDKDTGAGKRISNGEQIATVMKPSRDVTPFMAITSALGRDPYNTSVSCPIKSGGSYSGYGGAMGPSQFIPSTWRLYASKIASIAGAGTADPWNPEHAIIGTSLLMRDNGASTQTYTAERNAACKYYSGRSCSGSNEFYGNSVMKLADKIQADIDFLDGN